MTRLGSHLDSDNCLDVGDNGVQIVVVDGPSLSGTLSEGLLDNLWSFNDIVVSELRFIFPFICY
jgi:hypothetical protein